MSVKDHIDGLLEAHDVVLFMKGTRGAPQCGFSATVVEILDDFLEDYLTVDVLADVAIRDGIKEYSDWPTIPQLYVGAKFVGGSDVIREIRESGELEQLLGTGPRPLRTPEVTVHERAVKALRKHWDGKGKPVVRLEIDSQYRSALFFEEPKDDDIVLDADDFTLLLARSTARRADGVSIDWAGGRKAAGFKIENPNEPPRVRQVRPAELKRWMDEGKPMEIFDVRAPVERGRAHIEGSLLLDAHGKSRLEALDRDMALVLYDHHGARSQAAAEHCLRMGFREVYNLMGGIDVWSTDVDQTVPRY